MVFYLCLSLPSDKGPDRPAAPDTDQKKMLLRSSSSVGHKQSEMSLRSWDISKGQSVFDDVSNVFSVSQYEITYNGSVSGTWVTGREVPSFFDRKSQSQLGKICK